MPVQGIINALVAQPWLIVLGVAGLAVIGVAVYVFSGRLALVAANWKVWLAVGVVAVVFTAGGLSLIVGGSTIAGVDVDNDPTTGAQINLLPEGAGGAVKGLIGDFDGNDGVDVVGARQNVLQQFVQETLGVKLGGLDPDVMIFLTKVNSLHDPMVEEVTISTVPTTTLVTTPVTRTVSISATAPLTATTAMTATAPVSVTVSVVLTTTVPGTTVVTATMPVTDYVQSLVLQALPIMREMRWAAENQASDLRVPAGRLYVWTQSVADRVALDGVDMTKVQGYDDLVNGSEELVAVSYRYQKTASVQIRPSSPKEFGYDVEVVRSWSTIDYVKALDLREHLRGAKSIEAKRALEKQAEEALKGLIAPLAEGQRLLDIADPNEDGIVEGAYDQGTFDLLDAAVARLLQTQAFYGNVLAALP